MPAESPRGRRAAAIGRRVRLLPIPLLLLAATATLAPPAQAATLSSDAPPCLTADNNRVAVSASGFTPGALIRLRIRNETRGFERDGFYGPADASGNALITLVGDFEPDPVHSIEDSSVTAVMALIGGGEQLVSNTISVKAARAGFTSTRTSVQIRPAASRTLTFTGLPPGEQLWAHLRLGSAGPVTSLPVGVAAAPCGTLTAADVRYIPFANPAPGIWSVQYDTSATFSPANAVNGHLESFTCNDACRGGTKEAAGPGLPAPVAGRTVNAAAVQGTVTLRRPGQAGRAALTTNRRIPVGSTLDTTKGRVRVTSAGGSGVPSVSDLYGGRFRIAQARGQSLLRLVMTGPQAGTCPRTTSALASSGASATPPPLRVLGGSGSGRYRIEGRHSTTSVRGAAIWLVEDRCEGTLTRVVRGSASVRDLVARHTVTVRAGDTYLARRR